MCVICLLKHCEIDAAEACRAAVLLPIDGLDIFFFLRKERSSLSLSMQNEGHATPKGMLASCGVMLSFAVVVWLETRRLPESAHSVNVPSVSAE